MKYLGLDEEYLKDINSYNTAKEIDSQIDIWNKAISNFEKNKKEIDEFLNKLGNDYDVVFSGAGTSEYVGNILAPMLNRRQEVMYKSLSTTDVVNNPLHYLKKDRKTLLVSFARSGNSPESVATVELANKLVKNVYHLFITCNEEGELAKMAKTPEFKDNTLVLMMPEGSNDKGFAMTSSFSSMLMTAMLIFNKTEPNKMREAVKLANEEKENKLDDIKKLANEDQERIIVLGDGPFRGLAEELTLKVMELTAGKVVAKSDTTLGFRHGPKSIINEKTIVFQMISQDPYAKKYELDLLAEMYEENRASNIVAYSIGNDKDVKEVVKTLISAEDNNGNLEKAIFTYLMYGQIYAFYKSQYFKLTTDNPFPSGEVNRVVKKFQIHNYEEK